MIEGKLVEVPLLKRKAVSGLELRLLLKRGRRPLPTVIPGTNLVSEAAIGAALGLKLRTMRKIRTEQPHRVSAPVQHQGAWYYDALSMAELYQVDPGVFFECCRERRKLEGIDCL